MRFLSVIRYLQNVVLRQFLIRYIRVNSQLVAVNEPSVDQEYRLLVLANFLACKRSSEALYFTLYLGIFIYRDLLIAVPVNMQRISFAET